ncbi:MAG: M23 family metallopeptidase [Actinobacteria bacterium]|nr:M23 family metallopeptidase [Actinomycetota bacterium]
MRALVVVLGSLALVPSAYGWTDSGRQLELDWPADGRLNSPFGWDGGRPHAGLDIGVLRSLDVHAAEDGVVTRVGWIAGYDGYGMIVEIQLNERYSNLYAHLSKATVRVGQNVRAGDRLGLAGCTGRCTGTHLHFELRDREVPIDPMPLITGYNLAS